MTGLRALFIENPELRRNLRIELSSRRVFTAGIITALFALIVLPSLLPGNRPVAFSGAAAAITPYLLVILWSQRITLVLGGAISCWRAVKRERELNTWDFQRITRLSPLELAVGKLFGAPALAYFVTLCLVPPALFSAATTSAAALWIVFETYLTLFTGALVIHAFALMISTISDRGGAVSGLVLLLILQIFPIMGLLMFTAATSTARNFGQPTAVTFYGVAFPLTLLSAALELGFTAWFLLAVVRNIKADLDAMQLFTVRQGLGFAAYCNFVWIGFYPWWATSIINTNVPALLFISVLLFYMVGIGVLQSRELVRRGLRETSAPLQQNARLLGPIGSLLAGAIVTELVILALANQQSALGPRIPATQQVFVLLYFAAWLARDLFYLQWMKVRPVHSPLRKAFLYLGVFYLSASIVFRSALTSTAAPTAAFAAWFAPFSLLRVWTEAQWEGTAGMWLLALVAQLVAAAAFAFLYRQQLMALATRPRVAPPVDPARLSSTPA